MKAEPADNTINAGTNVPLISVIMPAYNAEEFITESIKSVIDQTYTNWELIIVDDGSVDKTAAIVQEIISNEPRVKYIYQQNGRQGKARNNGLQHAKGEYIAFLDADDLWLPQKLEKQIELFSKEKNTDLVFSDASIFSDQPPGDKQFNITAGHYEGKEAIEKFFLNYYIPTLTVIARKKAIDAVNGFIETYEQFENEKIQTVEDHDLWTRMLIAGSSFTGMPEITAYYRLHETSASSGDRLLIFAIIKSLEQIAVTYPAYREQAEKSIIARINFFLSHSHIDNWRKIDYLLKKRNELSRSKTNIRAWHFIYKLFGKRVFRVLSLTRQK